MPQDIQIIKPLMRAWGMTIRLLFRPFTLQAWLIFGLLVWVTTLGEYLWISPGNQFSLWFDMLRGPGDGVGDSAWLFRTFIRAAVLAVTIPMVIVLVWLRSRAVFCLFESVATNKPQVIPPFSKYAAEADSYFRWSLLFLAGWVVVGLSISFIGVLFSLPEVTAHGLSVWSSRGTFAAAFLGGIFTIALGFGCTLLESVIAPVMFLHRKPLPEAAVIAWENIIKPQFWAMILIYLIRLGFYSAMALIFAAVMLITLCCLCGLAPLFGALLLLPFFMLPSVFSLTFLDQFKPDFEVFKPGPGEYFCPHCDYDLRGTPMARKCPECGQALTPRPDLVGFHAEPGAATGTDTAHRPAGSAGHATDGDDANLAGTGAADRADQPDQPDRPAQGSSLKDIRESFSNRGYDQAVAPIDLDEPAPDTQDARSPEAQASPGEPPKAQASGDQPAPIEVEGPESQDDRQARPDGPRLIEPPTLLPEPGGHDQNRQSGYRDPKDSRPDDRNPGSIL